MRCIDRWLPAAALALLSGCAQQPAAPAGSPARTGTAAAPSGAPRAPLPAAATPGNWNDFQRQAALRIVAASPVEATYAGTPPPVLLAIPVIEVELHADGRVKATRVLRRPTQAADTTQLAIDAVHRAGPYGDVSRLPRPWKFVEVFLFDDARRFKPRTLDD